VAWLRHHNLAFVTAVNELITRNSPPKLGGEPARTAKREPDRAKPQKKSEQAGWFPCRYWQLREPPRPRLRSGTPPNLGGECPHSNSFTAPMSADQCSSLDIAGGHFLRLRAAALALRVLRLRAAALALRVLRL